MKVIILVSLALVAAVVAAPPPEEVKILRSEFQKQPDGPYNFEYETADGSVRQESGDLKEVLDEDNKPRPVIVVRGTYSWVDKDGKPQSINYFADESGYHAEGDSIPKPVSRR